MKSLTAFFSVVFTFTQVCEAYEHSLSPNKQFDAYTTSNHKDGTGMCLYLRSINDSGKGMLIAANDRWIEATWSPNSRFLALNNHTDGHISVILVFGVSPLPNTRHLSSTLLYVSPDPGLYNVKWNVAEWDIPHRVVILQKQVRSKKTELLNAFIGKTPIFNSWK